MEILFLPKSSGRNKPSGSDWERSAKRISGARAWNWDLVCGEPQPGAITRWGGVSRNYALSGRLDNKIGHLAPGRVLAGGEDLDYAGPIGRNTILVLLEFSLQLFYRDFEGSNFWQHSLDPRSLGVEVPGLLEGFLVLPDKIL
jgi:hypothetical protein